MRHAVFLLAMLPVPAGAMAQEVSHSLADLRGKGILTKGEGIVITADLSGNGEYEELKTKIWGLSDSAISIMVDPLPHGQMQNVSRSEDGWIVEVPEDRVQTIIWGAKNCFIPAAGRGLARLT